MRIDIPGVPLPEEKIVKLLLKAGIKVEADEPEGRSYARRCLEMIAQTMLSILENVRNVKHPEKVHVYIEGKEVTDPKKKLKSMLLWPKMADLDFEPNAMEALAAAAIQIKNDIRKKDSHLKIRLTDNEICERLKADPLKVEAIVLAMEGKTFTVRSG